MYYFIRKFADIFEKSQTISKAANIYDLLNIILKFTVLYFRNLFKFTNYFK